MKIATLQFAPRLGEVSQNIAKADSLLAQTTTSLDLLVLPELAFSGYNFPSLAAITPFLEPTAAGPTTAWAIRTATARNCTVIVGYPEISAPASPSEPPKNYNSSVTIGPKGEILANYRKSFLYYTDETWATEGFRSTATQMPFFASSLGSLGVVGHGICMDINPYQFTAPWTNYEFANAMLRNSCKLVVLSMAWLTRLTPEDTAASPTVPDMETVAYWLERFWPLQEAKLQEPVTVVFANRCGWEGEELGDRLMEHGERIETGNRVAYAGSSCVMRFQGRSVKLWEHFVGPNKGEVGLLGKGEEGVLVVDTGSGAGFLLQQKA